MRKADLIPFKYRQRFFGSPPVSARHAEWSAIVSTDDETIAPSDELIEIVMSAIERARPLRLDALAARCHGPQEAMWVNHWPGDHYRLLPALAEAIAAKRSVEVGTFTGMGTLSLAYTGMRVDTYDILPWARIPDTLLRASDFEGAIEQHVGDLAIPEYFNEQKEILKAADLIFVDGPKDGIFEPKFVSMLLHEIRPEQLIVFDDIRKLVMLQLWRDLPLDKLDVTSFGHWAGTGIARARP